MNALLKPQEAGLDLAALAAPGAEAAVISALLATQEAWPAAAGVTDADFVTPEYKAVFIALEALHDRDAYSNATAVSQWLHDHSEPGVIAPDAAAVLALAEAGAAIAADTGLLAQNVRAVREKAAQRKAAATLARLTAAAERPDADVAAIAARLDVLAESIRAASAKSEPVAILRVGINTPLSVESVRAVPQQHPHWMRDDNNRALYPVGEVSVVGGPGRAGKTLGEFGLLVTALDNQPVGGLQPPTGRVVIYSAEDSVEDYTRMFRAQQIARSWADTHLARILERLRVPDLHGERGRLLRTILTQGPDRLPLPTATADWIIRSCRGQGVTLIVFETLSKLSEVDETNIAFKRFVATLERIAEAVHCAVVLVHHVSQASLPNLKNLDLDTSAFRGGTALPDDARQTAMMVNLGSRDEPTGGDDDCRTRLREMAFPGKVLADHERITVYVTIDSSKSAKPHPIFLKWVRTDYGPAAIPAEPTGGECARAGWERLVEAVRRGTPKPAQRRVAAASQDGWTIVGE